MVSFMESVFTLDFSAFSKEREKEGRKEGRKQSKKHAVQY